MKKKLSIKKIIIKILLSIFFVFFIVYFSTYFIKVEIDKIPYSKIIYDENNIKIGEIIEKNNYRHEKVEFEEIPEFMKKSIILMEDKTFWKNNGVDFIALVRAVLNNLSGKNIQGASTISTQVIRNNYWLNKKRTFFIKLKEFYLALALNNHYSKEEILSNYLGNIYFGYLNYGVKSASNYYFGKDLKNLTKAEQISLLVLPKNPFKYNIYKKKLNFRKRFNLILDLLKDNGLIDDEEFEKIKNEKIILNYKHENKLPYVIDFLEKKINFKNSKIYTTIDYNLTEKIKEISKNSINKLFWKNVGDYSIIIVDKKTKNIKVMIGGIDYSGEDGQVNMIISPRQVGSTIKPFTYLLSFRDLGYKPETMILDLPAQFKTDLGYSYNPKNYSLDYKGEVSIAEALSQSINIPAIKIAGEVGVGNLLNFLKQLGITSLNKDENHYGLALTLGVGEISLFELTRAYSVFAYDGKYCDFNLIKGNNLDCENIVEKKYTDMIKSILMNRYIKINAFPINGNLDFPNKQVFLKTGTSRNFKDNWTVGYTKNYIIGVWAGNKDGSPMKGVSGASGAGEIFKKVVDYIEDNSYENKLTKKEIIREDYLEIISPLSGSNYKIDENIKNNLDQIKLEFKTNLKHKKYKWFLNGKELNNNFIKIKKGKSEIKLIIYDENDKIIREKVSEINVE